MFKEIMLLIFLILAIFLLHNLTHGQITNLRLLELHVEQQKREQAHREIARMQHARRLTYQQKVKLVQIDVIVHQLWRQKNNPFVVHQDEAQLIEDLHKLTRELKALSKTPLP